jgi:hypothetical protein
MQQAVLRHFPDTRGSYEFANRDPNMRFSRQSVDHIKGMVSRMLYIQRFHSSRLM